MVDEHWGQWLQNIKYREGDTHPIHYLTHPGVASSPAGGITTHTHTPGV